MKRQRAAKRSERRLAPTQRVARGVSESGILSAHRPQVLQRFPRHLIKVALVPRNVGAYVLASLFHSQVPVATNYL